MSPVRHAVSGEALSFALDEEMELVRGELATASGRIARTLIKDKELRVTLVGLSAGGELKVHFSPGPLTVQVLEGAIEFGTSSRVWALSTGMLLSLEAGMPHSVKSAGGALFLLTVVKSRGVEPQPGE